MNILRATVTYFVLVFTTVFIWFVLGRYMIQIMVAMSGAVDMEEVTAVTSNCVLGTNVTFVFLLIVWTLWYAYVAHAGEYEQTYNTKKF